ncbi:MAG: adenylate/guanylate cyclase domain-containing protein [Saprospiraceae bacterium]|nr:adenylate/guanylate cyclase domain-containing protein [Saprospiraceae bacterium]
MNLKLREWIFTIGAFIIALYLYSLFSYFGIKEFLKENLLTDYFDSGVWHIEVILGGLFLGVLFILVNKLAEHRSIRKKGYGFNILFKSILHFVALFLVCFLIYHGFKYFGLINQNQIDGFKELLSANFLLSGLLYYSSIILIMNFILHINKKIGPGSMMNLLTGKYYHPKSEDLIFLFLDLKGSTALAEKLGHNLYSRLIKECIHELTPIIVKHQASVYQYVGDEVVLYWKQRDGLSRMRCVRTFFDFIDALKRRERGFISRYGELPTFKAGMDFGTVTATEIGDIKRDIAFHGDVLNTASRLEKKCNDYNERLIISQNLVDKIPSNGTYNYTFLSDLPLKGKSESLSFYGVNPN